MLNRLGSLRFFLAVVNESSVRRAARACNISQPALTRHIQSLEEELGVVLFERTSRGMELTPFGEIVQHYARQIAFSGDDLIREVGEVLDGSKGTLRISAGPGWSYSIVPEAISRMHRSNPGIRVECNSELVGESLKELRSGNVDIVINRLDSLDDGGGDLVQEQLLVINHFIFAGRDHPLRSREKVGVRDLQGFPWISFRNSVEARKALGDLFENAALHPPAPTVVTNSYQTSLNLLHSGPYLMILPSTLARNAHHQEVETLPLDAELGSFPAGLIYRRSTARLAYFEQFTKSLEVVVQERSLDDAQS